MNPSREKTRFKAFVAAPLEGEKAAGEGTAVIASIGEVDADKEVILPGALQNPGETVSVMSQHGWTDTVPFGTAKAREENGKIVMEFSLLTNTDSGQRFYEAVKARGRDQEWSVGITVTEQALVLKDDEQVRELRKFRLNEVSAVIRGAQPGTHTVSMKEESSMDEDRVEALEKSVKELQAKVVELQIALRTQGKNDDPAEPVAPGEAENPPDTDDAQHVGVMPLPADLTAQLATIL